MIALPKRVGYSLQLILGRAKSRGEIASAGSTNPDFRTPICGHIGTLALAKPQIGSLASDVEEEIDLSTLVLIAQLRESGTQRRARYPN
jgi:hypothetical protein